MHSINFLLIIPECFQIVLINFFLLFAICFSYYKTQNSNINESASWLVRPSLAFPPLGQKARAKVAGYNSYKVTARSSNKGQQLLQQKEFAFHRQQLKQHSLRFSDQKAHTQLIKANYAYIATPVALIEPIIQLIILALICCSILYINSPLTYAIGLTDSIIWDNLSRLMSVLLCVSASVSLLLGITAIKRFGRYEFLFIIWLSIIGMLCLLKSYNLLTFYLSIELQSLSFYMLAAMRSKTEASAEAGLKYFILSAFSSAILLLGITLLYSATGSQNFADLSIIIDYFSQLDQTQKVHSVISPISLGVGLACICVSLLFKLAAAPFHLWVADVYEGSPTPITAFFAITAKVAAATALIRILELHATTLKLLPFVAVLSLIIGSFSAMRQVKLKRLLAFSGVANVGWFLLALITGQWDLLIVHLIVYILLSICLFSIFVLPLFRTHPNLEYRQRIYKQDSNEPIVDHGTDSLTIKYISDLNQLNKTNPSLAFAIIIAFFSLAGIPPFAGFYSKYLIINALTQTEQYLALCIALGSAILSAFYYIRVIKTTYFGNTPIFYSFDPSLSQLIPFKKHIFVQPTNNKSNTDNSSLAFPLLLPPLGQKAREKGNVNTRSNQSRIQSDQDKFKMFTIMPNSLNAYICAFSTILTILFFFKPDYVLVCIALSQ
jgi:NADH-quinone oxidoreductase subunit N